MSCLSTRDMLLLSQTQQQRSPPRHTSNHMSNSQCEKLVELCKEYYDIISDTGNSIESRTQRRRIWELIANQLNEKLSEASTSSERASAFGSPLGFTPLPTPIGFPPSFFNPPLISQTTTSIHHPTPVSLVTLAAATASPAAAAAVTAGAAHPIYAPIPQMGIPTLNLQSLMSSIAANEKAAAAVAAAAAAGRSPVPLEPGTAAEVRSLLSPSVHSPKSEPETLMSSPGAELHETLMLADADPVDVFCISLAESLSRIKSASALLYTQLKRDISVLVLDSEIKLLEREETPSLQGSLA
ncbi:hypothetical protein PRIPAC_73539 [Pristionchus pacificus]|uniref:Regulatory protein zeste n=1 Tax=Pristionchus pacificus TaxID=54126 RepID=A0A2A6BZV8_PRIPA|nr:hypothetical protein PRIPAC_73539 [Pristionchus pacificus]|eukprot:PDM71474.1 hypothetical protein PRIPAC_37881 [Pristionchus pacificus]